MNDEGMDRKAALKKLREERKEIIERNRARMAVTTQALKMIQAELSRGPQIIPELARLVGLPTREVLWYVMALKKYGKVAEGAKKGRGESYYPYQLVDHELIGDSAPKADEEV